MKSFQFGNRDETPDRCGESPAFFESLEERLLLAAAPTFGEAPGELYWLNGDGLGLTLGLDGEDADGDALTVSVSADDDTGLFWSISDSTGTNRFAVLHFFEADGVTPIGEVTVQLFEDRAPVMTERFITLAENYITAEGVIEAPTIDNPAFYTDVPVHRVIDEFMFQSGDAENGDGTGASPLDDFDTETDDHLAFTNGGVLAAANAGAGTTNSQWFITEVQTPWLDGQHTIFGQVISGWDVYQQIISVETDDNDAPLSAPRLGSVDIVASPQDATVTFWADETFTGPAEITITLDDGNGGAVDHVLTLVPEPTVSLPETVFLAPGQTATAPVTIDFNGDPAWLSFVTEDLYAGDGELTVTVVEDVPGVWNVVIDVPVDYDGSYFEFAVAALVDGFDNRQPANIDAVTFGYSYEKPWLAIAATDLVLPDIDALPDIEIVPGATVEIVLPMTYSAGSVESDLTVWLESDYDNGGTLEISDAAFTGGAWTVSITAPADYDGAAFSVTAKAAPTYAYGTADPAESAFTASFGQRPVIDPLDELLLAPQADAEITLTVTDDLATEFTYEVVTDDEGITASVDADTKKLHVGVAEDFSGPFTLTVRVWETDLLASYPDLAPGTLTVSGAVVTMDQASSTVLLVPGGTTTIPIHFSDYIEGNDPDFSGSTSAYVGEAVTVVGEAVAGQAGWFIVKVTPPVSYTGADFVVTISADFGNDSVIERDVMLTAGTRPQVQLGGSTRIAPSAGSSVPLTIVSSFPATVTVETPNPNPEVAVSYNSATGNLDVTVGAFAGQFDVTVSVVETGWAGYAGIEATEATFTFSTTAGFVSDPSGAYVLSGDGYGLTIPVDAWAPNDANITLSATSSSAKVQVWATNNNPIAELVFTDADGNDLGSIHIELFADRFPVSDTDDIESVVERFLTLATREIIRQAYDLVNDEPTYATDPAGTPFYTDVPVSQVATASLFTIGDPNPDDDYTASGMPQLTDDFGPAPYASGALGFNNAGAVAMIRNGEDSADNMFFIANTPNTDQNGNQMVFGQVISGWDVLDAITTTPINGNSVPIEPPVLSRVEILENNPQDGSVTIVPKKGFSGQATVDITIESNGQSVTRQVTVLAAGQAPAAPTLSTIPAIAIAPGAVVEEAFTVESEADVSFSFLDTYAAGAFIYETISDGDGNHTLRILAPTDYDGSRFDLIVKATVDGYANAAAGYAQTTISFNARPTISGGGEALLAPAATFDETLEISDDQQSDLTVAAVLVDQDGVDLSAISVDLDPDSYELTVDPGGFEGIFQVRITAVETVYAGVYSSIAPSERIYTFCTYNNGEALTVDDSVETVTTVSAGPTEAVFTVDITYAGGATLTYTAWASTFKIPVTVTESAGDGFGNSQATVTVKLPTGYFGIFEVYLEANYDDPNAEDNIAPAGATVRVLATADDSPVTQNNVQLSGEYTSIIATAIDGDLMYALTANQGVVIYDISDPANPAETDAYDSDQGYSATNRTMEVIKRVVDGQMKTYVLVGGSHGLLSLQVSPDGEIVDSRVTSILVGGSGRTVYDLAVNGDYVYAACGVVVAIIDIADPGRPSFDSSNIIAGLLPTTKDYLKYQNNHYSSHLWRYPFRFVKAVEVRNGRLYAAESLGELARDYYGQVVPAGCKGWVGIWGLHDPLNPGKRGILKFSEPIQDIEMHGNKLLVALDDGVKSYSVANPDRPTPLNRIGTEGKPAALSVFNQTIVVSTAEGYEFIDLTNPRRMTHESLMRMEGENWHVQTLFGESESIYEFRVEAVDDADVLTMYLPAGGSGIISADASDLGMGNLSLSSGQGRRVFLQDVGVTFRIAGGGVLDVNFDAFGNGIDAITVTGATESTAVAIVTQPGLSVTVGAITLDGAVRRFSAPGVSLTGDFTADGVVAQLILGDIGGADLVEQTISMAAGGADSTMMRFGWISDASIDVPVPIRSLTAYGWVDDETDAADVLTAPAVGVMKILGRPGEPASMQADLTINQDGGDDSPFALANALIKGELSEAAWSINGDVNKLNVTEGIREATLDAQADVNVLRSASAIANAAMTVAGDLRRALVLGDLSDSAWSIGGDATLLNVRGGVANSSLRVDGSIARTVVAESLSGSTLTAGGDMNVLLIGNADGSDIYAGYVAADPAAVSGLPDAADLNDAGLFDLTATIKTIKLTGYRDGGVLQPGMVNSAIAAGTVATAIVRDPQVDNADAPFGLAADSLGRLTRVRTGQANQTYRDLVDPADSLDPLDDDFIVRIV